MRTGSAAETEAVGADLGRRIGAGAAILLYGGLGAGKTTFVRGLAQGLGIPPEEVSSPTFVLQQAYRGRLTLHHLDLYRMSGTDPRELDELGLDELLESGGVVVIEWAERLPSPVPGAIRVEIADAGDDARDLLVVGEA